MIIDDTLDETGFESCFGDEPTSGFDPAGDLVRGRARRRHRRRLSSGLVAVSGVAVVVVLATASPTVTDDAAPVAPASGSPTPTSPLLPPDADHRIVYYQDISSDPWPANGPTVRISAARARAILSRYGDVHDAVLTLRLVSSTKSYHELPSRPTPYWVATRTYEGGRPMGKYLPGDTAEEAAERERRLATLFCVEYTFVDATTGRPSATTQVCS